jgi:hypothetical protein
MGRARRIERMGEWAWRGVRGEERGERREIGGSKNEESLKKRPRYESLNRRERREKGVPDG